VTSQETEKINHTVRMSTPAKCTLFLRNSKDVCDISTNRILASLPTSVESRGDKVRMINADSTAAQLLIEVRGLEKSLYYPQDFPEQSESNHEEIKRVRKSIVSHKIYSAVFRWVPVNYYDLTLEKRAQILAAHSTFQLCKSMLMENKAFASSEENETYSKFYLIILQYKTSINTKKLQSEIRALRPVQKRLDPSKFDFRVASDDDNTRLTGYSHNAVSPFGMLQNVPIILSKAIMEQSDMNPFVWMGGGHVHCKLGLAVSDFIRVIKPFVLDVADPR
jgi:prolyl-tRNA editing enzyme YbaK/EbsC (Cys-tRNA(Pro) deacylase)